MKTMKFLGCLAALTMTLHVSAQVAWDTNGNTVTGTDWFGADNTSTVPLRIRHDAADQPIEFHTAGDFRALINPRITYSTLGSFSSVPAHGFALITPNNSFFNTVKGPFTRLHLADGGAENAQQLAFRPWMSNGITFTGNADHGYMGQKYQGADITDMVVHWSDNPGNERKDRLRFLFTSGYDPSASSGAQSVEGLEGMRLWPKSFREVNVGVGDFYADGTEPSERLHVLNGRVRIEELPNDLEAEGLTKVVVVDDAATDEHGVLKWMNIANLIPVDCEWQMNTGANNHLSTAFGPSDPNCPDDTDAVGIGVDLSITPPPGKLAVVTDVYDHGLDVSVGTSGLDTRGVNVFSSGGANYNFGLFAAALGNTARSRGVHGESNGATFFGLGGEFISNDDSDYAVGAEGYVTRGTFTADGLWGYSVSNAGVSSGVRGTVNTPTPSGANKKYNGVMGVSLVTPVTSQRACGVYGEALGVTDSWAIYANGNQFSTTGTAWTMSDAQLKQNIEPLANATAMVMQLQPRSYAYRTEEYPQLHLATEPQFGFVAQELEQVLPDMVRDVFIPSETDSTGQELQGSMSVKAVKLDGILPLVVAAMKEQQMIILAQQEAMNEVQQRLDEMQHALAACCANPDGSRMQAPTNSPEPALDDRGDDRKLRIVPNPFNESTTVYYTLERGGRTQLMANSADGRELRVLQEANLAAGDYQFQWHTAALAPGMYYITLLLDGQPVVKKAVKVDR